MLGFNRHRRFYSLVFLGSAVLFFFFYSPSPPPLSDSDPKSIYDITVKDIGGDDVGLGVYAGKVLLVVNVASKCGFTQSNYKEMNILYGKYKDEGLEILAFPCNQFGGQEPGNSEEIRQTCSALKAEFPIFKKVEVNGENASVLYKFLKSQKNGVFGDSIKWNFTKFLIDRQGNVIQRYAPTTSPLQIEEDIRRLLGVH